MTEEKVVGHKLVGRGDIPALLASGLTTLSGLPESILVLAGRFGSAGHEIALVGGPVRDAFLGVEAHDFDLTTSALPNETEAIMREVTQMGAERHAQGEPRIDIRWLNAGYVFQC